MPRFTKFKDHIIFRPQNACKSDMEMIENKCKEFGISLSQFMSSLIPSINYAIHNSVRVKGGKILVQFDLGEIAINEKVQEQS